MIIEYGRAEVARPWLERTSRAIAAASFAAGAAGGLVLFRALAHYPSWLPKMDEPDLFWATFPAFMVAVYAIMLVLPRRAKPGYFIPPGMIVALIVCGFDGLLAYDYVSIAALRQYFILLAVAVVLSSLYVVAMVRRSAFAGGRSAG